MKTIYFVRHCQPDISVHEDRIRPLTEQGRADALRVTEFFRDIPVGRVVSSPYLRTVDTVRGVAESHNLPLDTDEDLRERAVGAWVEDFDAFARAQWMDFDYALPGGESLRAVTARGQTALRRLLDDPAEIIVVGCHGTAVSALIHSLDDTYGYEGFQRMVGITPWIARCTFDGGRFLRWENVLLTCLGGSIAQL